MASLTTSSSDGRPHFILMVTFGPPIGLALPCMVWAMVTPPLSAVRIDVSSALMTAPTSASGVMASEPSFVPARAMWVCESMMPGRTNRPAASTTRTPGGAAISPPTCLMTPLMTRMSPLAMTPLVTVRSVPFLIRMLAPSAHAGATNAAAATISHKPRRQGSARLFTWSPPRT